MIIGPLLLALALNAHRSYPDSKVILAKGDTLSGPAEIMTNDNGMWTPDEYVAITMAGKTYPAGEIKSARLGNDYFYSLRKNGASYLGLAIWDARHVKAITFSPGGMSPGFGLSGGPGGGTPTFGDGMFFDVDVDYYTVNMTDAAAINYDNLVRDMGDCPDSRRDLTIHKTLIYTALGGAINAALFGITAAIIWNLDKKDKSGRHDALINGLGATAGVSGMISVGSVVGLGSHLDHFLQAAIKNYCK